MVQSLHVGGRGRAWRKEWQEVGWFLDGIEPHVLIKQHSCKQLETILIHT